MKSHSGFISNSSACSFCIYGWNEKALEKKFDKINEFIKIAKEHGINLICIYDSNASVDWIGVGNCEDELDHWYGEGWQNYNADEPSDEEIELLDKLTKKMGLPEPKIFSNTWYDG